MSAMSIKPHYAQVSITADSAYRCRLLFSFWLFDCHAISQAVFDARDAVSRLMFEKKAFTALRSSGMFSEFYVFAPAALPLPLMLQKGSADTAARK